MQQQEDPWQFIPYVLGSIAKGEGTDFEAGVDTTMFFTDTLGMTAQCRFALKFEPNMVQANTSEVAKHYLLRALKQTGKNKSQAARLLGLGSYQTVLICTESGLNISENQHSRITSRVESGFGMLSIVN